MALKKISFGRVGCVLLALVFSWWAIANMRDAYLMSNSRLDIPAFGALKMAHLNQGEYLFHREHRPPRGAFFEGGEMEVPSRGMKVWCHHPDHPSPNDVMFWEGCARMFNIFSGNGRYILESYPAASMDVWYAPSKNGNLIAYQVEIQGFTSMSYHNMVERYRDQARMVSIYRVILAFVQIAIAGYAVFMSYRVGRKAFDNEIIQ